jgi:hypothetical protein
VQEHQEEVLMRRCSLGILATVLGASLTLPASTAFAALDELMSVKVPFAFRAGSATLPAGEYVIKQDDGDRNLLIETRDGRHSAWLFTGDDSGTEPLPAASELVFNRYGQQYFLSEVWVVDSHTGLGNEHEGFTMAPQPAEARTARPKPVGERVHVPATPGRG